MHVLRNKLDFPNLKRAVREQRDAFAATVILIEDKASGTQLIQELIEERISAITRFKPEGDKLMRLHAQTGAIENGFIFLPQEAHWLAEFIHELTTFPNSKYDDQVDSVSQFLAWTKQRKPGWGFLEYIRQEMEAHRAGQIPNMVQLRAPEGISHVSTLSGLQIAIPWPDRIIEVGDDDAGPLLGAGFQRVYRCQLWLRDRRMPPL